MTHLLKPVRFGMLASTVLLIVYVAAVSAISGWNYTLNQINAYWYFLVALAVGFGIQIGLYQHLKAKIRGNAKGVVAVTGTTSTVAMLSCCAHYLTTVLPVLGVTGLVTIIGLYQIELFWFGIVMNVLGIAWLWSKIKNVVMP